MDEAIVHTGQHYDESMSESFFRDLGIPEPAVNLEVGSGSHGAQTGRMLEGIEHEIMERNPDWVLVYGDTNSTVAGSLAAVKLHVPVAHVEAGLRSYNRRMPEEINRVVTDHVSDLLFAPTQAAVDNLAREGLAGDKVSIVGDVMYDAALFAGDARGWLSRSGTGLVPGKYVVATVHRADNTDDPRVLRCILEGLSECGLNVAFPVHPRTQKAMEVAGLASWAEKNLTLLPPLGYFEMAELVKNAAVVATDSGGLQKEAFFHGVPCVTLRTETEWTELVDLGWNVVQPPDSPGAVSDAIRGAMGRHGEPGNPYGDGHAASKIVSKIKAGRLATVTR